MVYSSYGKRMSYCVDGSTLADSGYNGRVVLAPLWIGVGRPRDLHVQANPRTARRNSTISGFQLELNAVPLHTQSRDHQSRDLVI